MNFLKIIPITIALSLAVISPASSKTMRSTTGANLGEIKTIGEGKENARLSIDASNVSVKKVTYGRYANQIYWENWNIEGGFLELQQTPNTFAHADKAEVKNIFEIRYRNDLYLISNVEINKLRNDLYQVNYRYNNIKNCSYIFFTYGTPGRFDGSGDKNIRLNLCDISSNVDKETISQEALYLLGSIRHFGNKVRTGYKIPKKGDIEKLGGVFAKAKVSPEMQLTIGEQNSCRSATLPSGEWDYSTASSQWYIDKAKLLGLDKNCRNHIRGQTGKIPIPKTEGGQSGKLSVEDLLSKVNSLLEKGLISEAEAEEKRRDILGLKGKVRSPGKDIVNVDNYTIICRPKSFRPVAPFSENVIYDHASGTWTFIIKDEKISVNKVGLSVDGKIKIKKLGDKKLDILWNEKMSNPLGQEAVLTYQAKIRGQSFDLDLRIKNDRIDGSAGTATGLCEEQG